MVGPVTVLAPGDGRPYVEGDSLDRTRPLVFTVDDVLTPAECDAQVSRIAALGPVPATITTSRGFLLRPDIRNNTRVIFDDLPLAAELLARVRPVLPDPLSARRPVGVNERFRGYRYTAGQRFAVHFDGAFRRDADEASLLTFMVYLDDGCAGGDTRFVDLDLTVAPRRGRALLFQHRLRHEGAEVVGGVKHVLRSDIMYRRAA